jgi:serine/threonine-protein kinase PpkA
MEIPGYKILKTLGQGGMATVYLAVQESFDRKVALKVMSAQLAQDPAFGDRFQREARIVSQMNHPNIVTVYDVGVIDNHHYLAMQFVDGKELRYRFGDMDLSTRLQAVREVAAALHYAGNKGYVHRDVKPDNVMISDEDGRAILMDFGIAKASDGNHSMTKTGMAVGTPYYMSPEQAQGKPVDKRSDLYSLGVMFFQLLTGRVPYDAESGVAIGIKHITEPVPMLPKHLQVFQPVLEKIMAKDPDKRYQTGVEIIKDLDAIDISKLDQVDKILQQEIQKANQTDPHAHTAMVEAAPPILNTGNITTADATRIAQKISAGELLPQNKINRAAPMIGAFIVVVLVLGGGWYFLEQQQQQIIEREIEERFARAIDVTADATTGQDEISGWVSIRENKTNLVELNIGEEIAVEEIAVEEIAVEEIAVEEIAAKEIAAKEIAAKEIAAKEIAAKEIAAKEIAAKEIAAKEKRHQEELARNKADAVAKAALAAKAEKEKRDEIARSLTRAKTLHESGALVAPENDNAVLAYRAVLEVDPGNTGATQALKTIEANYLLGVRTLIEQDQLDQAVNQLRSASNLFPDSATINELLEMHQEKQASLEMAKPVAATQPKVTKLLVSDTLIDNMQVAQAEKLPLNRTAHIGFSYASLQGATTLMQVVLYDSSRSVKIMQKPVVTTGEEGAIFTTLARPVEGFPEGGYTVDLMLGEQRMASVSFMVAR